MKSIDKCNISINFEKVVPLQRFIYNFFVSLYLWIVNLFQRVSVDEPSRDTTLEILEGIKKYYEEFHNVVITDEALVAAVDLSIKYQSEQRCLKLVSNPTP